MESRTYRGVLGIAGWSGSGKTTLIEKLISLLVAEGLRVATIKHTHHQAMLDQPGKDSWRHQQAGASEVMLVTGERWALLHEQRGAPEPDLTMLLARLSPCDLVLVEGFKRDAIPKIEVHRSDLRKTWLYPEDPHIVAVAADVERPATSSTQLKGWLALDDVAMIRAFIKRELGI